MNCHEAIDLMGDALEGRLAERSRAGFDEHLEECSPCRNYFDQVRMTLQALERLPYDKPTDERRAELIAAYRREWTERNSS